MGHLAFSCIIANILLTSPSSSDTSLYSLDSAVFIPVSGTSVSNSKQFNIAIIGAAAFLHASKLSGSSKFQICFCSLNIQANSIHPAETPDLSNILFKYQKFADIFSKVKAEILAPHQPYNLKINIEESIQPLVDTIYSLSVFSSTE